MMSDEYGVRPEDIEWVVSADELSAKDAGATSKQENVLPGGVSIAVGPEGKDESDLLVDGDVDALFHAVEPRAFAEGHPSVKRLFDDPRWLPFLESIGKSPEQLDAIEFKVTLPE